MNKILQLPSSGQLFIATDLHGNYRDFKRICELFERAFRLGDNPYFLFTGDLIHGPNWEEADWPEYLGIFFTDQSEQIIDDYIEFSKKYPGRVACLLGNHEHSHIGGPHTPKFWLDETLHLEQTIGPEKTELYKELFKDFPIVAVSQCGVAVTHAAPNTIISGPEEIENVDYGGYENIAITSIDQLPLLGKLLWSRTCPAATARRFIEALSNEEMELHVVVYGHEIMPEGYTKNGREQLCLSTSFGLREEKKYYLLLDLSACYPSTYHFREGIELLKLYDTR